MRIPTSVGYALSAAAAITLLAGCSGGSSAVSPMSPGNTTQSVVRHTGNGQVRSYSVLPNGPTVYPHNNAKSWMKHVDALTRLAYMSDFDQSTVTVYGRNAAVMGQIGGLVNPQGLFVDSNRNLWVANTGGADVPVFARGATSPSNVLNDSGQFPVDVTVCPNGTVYVSNIFGNSVGGNIAVYASGSTNPTGSLVFPGEIENFFITCDASGNVFTTLLNGSGFGVVVEYAGGSGSGTQLPISLLFPGGIKPNNAGNLLVNDQSAFTVTEYTESGSPTGNSISTGSGDTVDIGVTKNSLVVGGANASTGAGDSFTFPGGSHRQTYPGQGATRLPIGFAFDPGQNGLGT